MYWTLGDLPASCHSLLSNIYLAAFIHTKDVKYDGFETVLKPLVDELITRAFYFQVRENCEWLSLCSCR